MATFFAPTANNNFLPENKTIRSRAAEIVMWSVVGVAFATLMISLGISVARSENHTARQFLHTQGPANPPTAVIPGTVQDATGHVHVATAPNAATPTNTPVANAQPSAAPPGPGQPPPVANNNAPAPPSPPSGSNPAPSSTGNPSPPTTDVAPPSTTEPPPTTSPPDTTPDTEPPPTTSPPDTTPDTVPPTTGPPPLS